MDRGARGGGHKSECSKPSARFQSVLCHCEEVVALESRWVGNMSSACQDAASSRCMQTRSYLGGRAGWTGVRRGASMGRSIQRPALFRKQAAAMGPVIDFTVTIIT
jgi:hypothetical protein